MEFCDGCENNELKQKQPTNGRQCGTEGQQTMNGREYGSYQQQSANDEGQGCNRNDNENDDNVRYLRTFVQISLEALMELCQCYGGTRMLTRESQLMCKQLSTFMIEGVTNDAKAGYGSDFAGLTNGKAEGRLSTCEEYVGGTDGGATCGKDEGMTSRRASGSKADGGSCVSQLNDSNNSSGWQSNIVRWESKGMPSRNDIRYGGAVRSVSAFESTCAKNLECAQFDNGGMVSGGVGGGASFARMSTMNVYQQQEPKQIDLEEWQEEPSLPDGDRADNVDWSDSGVRCSNARADTAATFRPSRVRFDRVSDVEIQRISGAVKWMSPDLPYVDQRVETGGSVGFRGNTWGSFRWQR